MNAYMKRKLGELDLADLARAIEQQELDLKSAELTFDDRLNRILDALIQDRECRHIKRLIRNAYLKYPTADINTLDYESRDLNPEVIRSLAKMGIVESATNILITGPAGAGKTYLACALGAAACKLGFRTYYVRMPDIIRNFETLRENLRELKKYQKRIGNYSVLIIDEWLCEKVSDKNTKWIYELMEQRNGNSPTIFVGQYPKDTWYERLGGGTMAESILDRIVHNAYPITTNDTNLRQVYDSRRYQALIETL